MTQRCGFTHRIAWHVIEFRGRVAVGVGVTAKEAADKAWAELEAMR